MKLEIWQDPYGPSHKFYIHLSETDVRQVDRAGYTAAQVILGLADVADLVRTDFPGKLSDYEFARSLGLDFSDPEDRKVWGPKYWPQMEKRAREFLAQCKKNWKY